jgi:hypothetical protein
MRAHRMASDESKIGVSCPRHDKGMFHSPEKLEQMATPLDGYVEQRRW